MFNELIVPRIARESAELERLATHRIPHAIRTKNYTRLATLSDRALACQRTIEELESLRDVSDMCVVNYLAGL